MSSIQIRTFFESHCEVQKYALAYEPWDDSNLFPDIFFEFSDVRGFIGKGPVFQVTPKKEIWRAQVKTTGRPLEFCLQTNHAFSKVFLEPFSLQIGRVGACYILLELEPTHKS